jgi:cysteine desulfurase / selenocysteine lyase
MNKADFPIFDGRALHYLDNAATTQKPYQVIGALVKFYGSRNANIHRGIYKLSVGASEAYEKSREKIANFVNAKSNEVIFTKGTTEGINLVANSLDIKEGDEILISELEHHSNLVPWQQICKLKKAKLKYVKVDRNGKLGNLELNKKTKLVSLHHTSNFLGSEVNIDQLSKEIHDNGSLFMVDGAQSIPHMKFDFKKSNVDLLAFSGHKMLGPMGTGALIGKENVLNKLSPYQFGGDMIHEVKFEDSSWNDLPGKFEAGTPNVAGFVGLGTAIDYLKKVGMENIENHDKKLIKILKKEISDLDLEIYGENQKSLLSFNLPNLHSHDVASFLDEQNICVRAGHHCVMPFHNKLGINSSVRASFYLYNEKEDVLKLVEVVRKLLEKYK